MVTTRPPKTIVKSTALGLVANTDTKFLIYGLFRKGLVLAQDGVTRRRRRRADGGSALLSSPSVGRAAGYQIVQAWCLDPRRTPRSNSHEPRGSASPGISLDLRASIQT